MRNGSVSERLNKKQNSNCKNVSRTAYLKDVQGARQRLVISTVCISCLSSHAMWSSQCVSVLAVLDQIQDEWEPCTSLDVRPITLDKEPAIQRSSCKKFSPVDLALELLNESSPGKDMRSFQSTKRLLFDALKGSVDSLLAALLFSDRI